MSQTKDEKAEARQLELNTEKGGSSGVFAEGQAQADRNARPAAASSTLQPDAEGTLALRALELANEQGESPEATVQRAEQYLAFLKENNRG